MLTLRQSLPSVLPAVLAVCVLAPCSALAQGKLDARYVATLAGIQLGKGDWSIDIADTHYTAAASGTTTGLFKVFTNGHGSSAARGTWAAGKPISVVYSSTISTRKATDMVRLTMEGDSVKSFKVDPPDDKNPERVPITDEHRHGVIDPMTAMLMRVSGSGDPVSAQACERKLSIFDGRVRYDLQLAFKRIEQVKAEKGYAGPAVVCAVYVTPIAGYIPSRAAVKYLTKARDMELWLVPIAGTRVLVPFRAQGPTPVGEAIVEATQFTTVATPPRADNDVKTDAKAADKPATRTQ